MFNYLAFVGGGLSAPGLSPAADGESLARQCLQQLRDTKNPEQFPPRLLILLTSPAYQDKAALADMLKVIEERFAAYKREIFAATEDELSAIHLIGSSVEAVFFEREIQPDGALLICLASRLLETAVEVCADVRSGAAAAIDQLLLKLNLDPGSSQSNLQRPLTDRLLLSFMPNTGRFDENVAYLAPELHALLQRNRMPLVGGVSAEPGFQFAGTAVYENALVAARVFTGAPFGCSFGHGVQEAPGNLSALRATELAADGRIVKAFDRPGKPVAVLGLEQPDDKALLGELSLDNNPFITVAQAAADGESVYLTRRITKKTLLCRLAHSDSHHLQSETQRLFARSLDRWLLEKPAGCLALHCISRLQVGLDFPALAAAAEEAMQPGYVPAAAPVAYLGGFFAGEFGGDESGRFLFGNWSVATLCFSDEMRERAPAHNGFKAIAEIAPILTTATSLDEALPASLRVITETGFPGAMLSLVLENKGGDWLVALAAEGARYQRVREMTKRPRKDNDILAVVARTGEARFIPDSQSDKYCDLEAVEESGVISQYIHPLFDRKESLIAVLQFDLGDLRRRRFPDAASEFCLYKAEERILHSLAAVVQATLLRVFNRQETDLIKGLDEVLKDSLHITDRELALHSFMRKAAQLFGVKMAHIRLFNQKRQALEMTAGTGAYYELFKELRRFSANIDKSPTVEAYEQGDVVVVNDSAEDTWHRDMLKEYAGNQAACAVLATAKGYANVPIHNRYGEAIGTVSLIADESWFFMRPRVRAMHALAERINYLLEHFAEQERQILSHVLDEFVQRADLAQPIATLKNTVESFRAQVQADVASLYLWDAEANKFILRAECGWREAGWVDAARYDKGDLWEIGLPEPQYTSDLRKLKRNESGKLFLKPNREYVEQIFGQPLADLTIEAIALPLTSPKHEPLGILTLYRQMTDDPPEAGSGFATINPQRLREAAASWSAIVSMLLHNLEMNWLKNEMQQREDVRLAIERDDPATSIEQRLCQQMCKSFHAQQADLYLLSRNSEQDELQWASGALRNNSQANTAGSPDEFIYQAAGQRKIMEQRHYIKLDELGNPRIAKTEGVIERIGLPLLVGKQLVGVLDLRFRIERRHAALEVRHDPEMLTRFAEKIAVIYTQQKELLQQREAKAAEERKSSALQFLGIVASHSLHLFKNTLTEINLWGENFSKTFALLEKQGLFPVQEKGTFISQRIEYLHHLSDGTAVKEVTKALGLTRTIRDFTPRPCHLKSIIDDFLVQEEYKPPSDRCEWRVEIDGKLLVKGDYDLLSFAFHNVIHNALKHTPQDGVLTISAELSSDGQTVLVTFKDTGAGMTPEQLQVARGHGKSDGMGLPTTQHLIAYQGGQFFIDSKPNEGTTVVITLPNST